MIKRPPKMGWRHGEENIREADWETACLKSQSNQ